MTVTKPFKRTCRQFTDGSYAFSDKGGYILDPRYAKDGEHYVRALHLIQRDLQDIFDFVEPDDRNARCYSYRIHALHMRACIEVEANCKAILTENGFAKPPNRRGDPLDWNMGDYKKIEPTHLLSQYEVRLPVWKGSQNVLRPFASWAPGGGGSPLWYQAYNAAKHDRHEKFEEANFAALVHAVCGLVTILSAQFETYDFSPSAPSLLVSGIGGPPVGFEAAIGGYFWVKFPQWPAVGQYDFHWDSLVNVADPFQTHTY